VGDGEREGSALNFAAAIVDAKHAQEARGARPVVGGMVVVGVAPPSLIFALPVAAKVAAFMSQKYGQASGQRSFRAVIDSVPSQPKPSEPKGKPGPGGWLSISSTDEQAFFWDRSTWEEAWSAAAVQAALKAGAPASEIGDLGQQVLFAQGTGWYDGPPHPNFLDSIGSVASSVAGGVVGAIGAAAHMATTPFTAAYAIANGDNVADTLGSAWKSITADVTQVAPLAQAVISFVPGIGTGVAAALGAGVALAQGATIDEAFMAGVRGSIPGGPLVRAGFDAAVAVVHGKSFDEALMSAARNQLPSEEAKKAFDIGLAMVHGQNIQSAVAANLGPMAIAALGDVGGDLWNKATSGVSVPGLGVVSKAIQLAGAVGAGDGRKDPILEAVRSTLPPDVQLGFDVGVGILHKGQGLTEAGINLARSQLGNSVDALKGFDTASAIFVGRQLGLLPPPGLSPTEVAAFYAAKGGLMAPAEVKAAIHAYVATPASQNGYALGVQAAAKEVQIAEAHAALSTLRVMVAKGKAGDPMVRARISNIVERYNRLDPEATRAIRLLALAERANREAVSIPMLARAKLKAAA